MTRTERRAGRVRLHHVRFFSRPVFPARAREPGRSPPYDRTTLAKVLLVSPDRVAPNMAGPGVRYAELARALSRVHEVCLAAPLGSASVDSELPVGVYDPLRPGALRRLLSSSEIVIAPPLAPGVIGDVAGGRRTWIVDLYNAEPFEGLAHRPGGRIRERLRGLARIDRLTFAARCGAAFLCATERQRDMWLGLLAANRRLDPAEYRGDPNLRRLIEVVPFGLPSAPARRIGAGVRGGVFPADAKIMVWNGGVWDWFDPETVLAALVLLRREDPAWHLAFSGLGRPSHRAQMAASGRVLELVGRLGLEAERAVHVRDWTPYAERAAPLLDADMGVSAHRLSLEARFAHRARILDLVWTHTPILCTMGDEWSDIVVAEGLGEAVPVGDPDAFAEAATRIAERGRGFYAGALEVAAASRTWDQVAAPLIGLVESVASLPPRRPDLVGRGVALRHRAASAAQRYGRPLLARE
jgi:glycosyltransferase involved in cell wall biosynthesis